MIAMAMALAGGDGGDDTDGCLQKNNQLLVLILTFMLSVLSD